jgi:hypothetical protein
MMRSFVLGCAVIYGRILYRIPMDPYIIFASTREFV